MKNAPVIIIIALLSCSNKTMVSNKAKIAETNSLNSDTIPSVYLNNLEYNTVARWFYGDSIGLDSSSLKNGDTVIYGRIHNELYEPNGWIDEFIQMRGAFQSEYLEDGITKSIVIFIGDNFYQHGHTWSLMDVLFFEKEKDGWKFLDSLQVQEFDVGSVQQVDLCKNGISIWFKGEWANMGAVSSRESFIGFQKQEVVVDLSFWTYSGRMNEEEPYDMVEEDTAMVEIKKNPASDWNSIYYYSMRYDCAQKDIENNLSFCSSKWIFENGEYKVYPLKKSERKRK